MLASADWVVLELLGKEVYVILDGTQDTHFQRVPFKLILKSKLLFNERSICALTGCEDTACARNFQNRLPVNRNRLENSLNVKAQAMFSFSYARI